LVEGESFTAFSIPVMIGLKKIRNVAIQVITAKTHPLFAVNAATTALNAPTLPTLPTLPTSPSAPTALQQNKPTIPTNITASHHLKFEI
jgi:hypothetical protein